MNISKAEFIIKNEEFWTHLPSEIRIAISDLDEYNADIFERYSDYNNDLVIQHIIYIGRIGTDYYFVREIFNDIIVLKRPKIFEDMFIGSGYLIQENKKYKQKFELKKDLCT